MHSTIDRTAQEAYALLVKEHLSPAMRGLRFKGSRGSYRWPSEDCWALLGLQKSAFSDRDEVRFTANLFVIRRDDWGRLRQGGSSYPAIPTAGTHWGGTSSHERVTMLMTEDYSDRWWILPPDANLPTLAAVVMDAIVRYGVPWLIEELERRDREGHGLR